MTEEVRRWVHERQRKSIERALNRWPIDIVHMHGNDFYAYLPAPGVPVLVTLHLPPSWYPPEIFRLHRPQTYLHCVSRAQRRSCPAHAVLLPHIDNGVPIAALSTRHAKRRFAMMLGRMCSETCGTPVIAFPAGALPDIVELGRTGFLVQEDREMADAITAVRTLDPKACRDAVRRQFSVHIMVQQYLAVYRSLMGESCYGGA